MKEILKIMRFDHLTSYPLIKKEVVIVFVLIVFLGFFVSPLTFAYLIFLSMVFVVPLQNIPEKCGFNKLYGILPVKRKNITRARFMYIFAAHFAAEILGCMLGYISFKAELIKYLPNQGNEFIQLLKSFFESEDTGISFGYIIVVLFFGICLIFLFMEMMGQIFGRENEIKILGAGMTTILIIGFAFALLSEHDLIPVLTMPDMPKTFAFKVIFTLCANAIIFIIAAVFGEITAAKLIKREL